MPDPRLKTYAPQAVRHLAAAGHLLAAGWIVLADQLHHDVRRIALVDVEHAHRMIADHVARGASFGERERVSAVAMEQLDRDVAAELAVVCLPHHRARAGIEPDLRLVAHIQRGRGIAGGDRLRVRGVPQELLDGHDRPCSMPCTTTR